ncbi:isoquinoline 1-oxidoreductase subunit beta [Kordiimonas sediminis]|uniref:Isoquinoline 1-oxidoreductase subunit beta n=1 Tax=Kordiimonas sediminis TaxID=1735581 RepID=A0A919AXD8_9PROT|nr:molybdopterin cofactor-binding domain-containing protein [Kordiimonas sediminis]GHF30971.1 isoquinoline 1-oxidoreductase subunit beta [Kordiimonas sediminis]
MQTTRRDALKIFGMGGALVVIAPSLLANNAAETSAEALFGGMLGPFVKINADNSVIIGAPIADMGTGVETSVPMLVAEELDADWNTVTVHRMTYTPVKNAEGQMYELYATTGTGGSGSMRRSWQIMRECGAYARHLIVRAAAAEHGVAKNQIKTHAGNILLDGKSYPYADFVDAALKLPNDDLYLEDLSRGDTIRKISMRGTAIPLKNPKDFSLIGTGKGQKNAREIVTGAEVYGIDMDIEGQQFAVLARCPHVGGDVASFDDTETRKVTGVTDVRKIAALNTYETTDKPNRPGVAVIAKSLWAALKGREKLIVQWNKGPNTHMNSAWLISNADRQFTESEPAASFEKGDFDTAISDAKAIVETTYTFPYFGHFNMEPMNAAAHWTEDRCLLRLSHQSPSTAVSEVAAFTGLPMDKVTVEHGRIGCGLGRKWSWDNVMEAVHLSREVGTPIKVFWTREDDAQNDFLNPHAVVRMQAALDQSGNLSAWGGTFVCQWGVRLRGLPVPLIENVKVQAISSDSRIPVGAWRGPGHCIAGMVVEGMLNQLAAANDEDPLDFRLRTLGEDQELTIQDWMPFTNADERFTSTKKTKDVLKKAAEMAGWGQTDLPAGWGRAIASHMTFGGYAAFVVDVSMKDGWPTVERVFGAIDCGQVINRTGALAQIESGIHDALSTILHQGVDIEEGATQSVNFDQNRLLRIDEAPKHIQIEFIESGGEPWGLGEIALPAAIPAIVGAIENATGAQITSLPLGDQAKV